MTDKLQAAAQQALEVLKRLDEWLKIRSGGTGLMPDELNTIIALRAALAEQPAEQETVAPRTMIVVARRGLPSGRHSHTVESDVPLPIGTPIYTAPQPRKRLTETEIDAVWDTVPQTQFWWRRYARAIERAHGINVPQARGEQE